MTANILEDISTWLVDWSLVTIMGNTTPPPFEILTPAPCAHRTGRSRIVSLYG